MISAVRRHTKAQSRTTLEVEFDMSCVSAIYGTWNGEKSASDRVYMRYCTHMLRTHANKVNTQSNEMKWSSLELNCNRASILVCVVIRWLPPPPSARRLYFRSTWSEFRRPHLSLPLSLFTTSKPCRSNWRTVALLSHGKCEKCTLTCSFTWNVSIILSTCCSKSKPEF